MHHKYLVLRSVLVPYRQRFKRDQQSLVRLYALSELLLQATPP